MAKLYGETIPEYVAKQIKVREEVLGRKGNRTTEDLRVLSQKSAWVRMISGVDLDDENGLPTPFFAKNYILAGGVLKWTDAGYQFVDEKVNFSNNSNSRYSLTDNLGVRPVSGITSFDLKYKNRFGVIREANVNFVVWSREELNLVQNLFMRPGGQVIIEWGNSLYLDNNGEIQDTSFDDGDIGEYFKTNNINKVYEILQQRKEKTHGNVDGFLGLVTNFDWKVREDGGYDCSIKSVSRGALLESLVVTKNIGAESIPRELIEEVDKDSELYEFNKSVKSLFHYFAYLTNLVAKEKPGEVITVKDLDDVRKGAVNEFFFGRIDTGFSKLLNKISGVSVGEKKLPVFTTNIRDKNDEVVKWTSLRTILFLLNQSISISEKSNLSFPKFFIGDKELEPSQPEIAEPPKYRTFPLHFSLDPLVAILPKPAPSENEIRNKVNDNSDISSFRLKDGNSRFDINIIGKTIYDRGNLSEAIRKEISNKSENNSSPEDILNIFVNINVVKNLIDENVNVNDDGTVGFKVNEFLESLLSRINVALGGVNSLNIHVDHDTDLSFIVDRDIVSKSVGTENRKIIRLSESGLSNTVSKLDIQSKITSQLSSMIAISAQSDDIRDTQADTVFIDWTKGGKNRFYLPKEVTDSNFNEGVTTCEEEVISNGIPKYRDRDVVRAVRLVSNLPGLGGVFSGTVGLLSKTSLGTQTISDEFINAVKDCKFKKLKESNKIYYFLTSLASTYQTFRSSNNFDTINERFKTIRNSGQKNYKYFLEEKVEEKEIGVKGIIPIELSMEVDGISGMKIGQIFRLGNKDNPSILTPAKYDEYGFIIVGLDTKIGTDNKWITNIRAQTFKIGDLD